MRNSLRLFLVFALFLLPLWSQAKIVDRILAVVNGQVITLVEFEEYVKLYRQFNAENGQIEESYESEAFKAMVLDQMVNEMLVIQEADRFEIDVADGDVQGYIERYKANKKLSDSEFLEDLQQQGLSLEDFKEKITRDIKKNRVINSMIRQKVVVTEAELRAYYESHQDLFEKPRQVHLRLLVAGDRELLQRLRKQVLTGNLSFGQAAKEHSLGPGAEQGGDLGVLDWDDLGAVWKQALSGLQEQEPSHIFELKGSLAILYPESLSPGKTAAFDQVKESIRERIYAQKLNNRFQEYITQLRSKAVLDIRL